MPYTPNTWADDDPAKPLSAARMTVMETGIAAAQNDQTGDVTLSSDTGNIILKTGGVERARISATGTGSGLLGGSLPALILGNDGATNYGPNTGTPSGNVIPNKTQVLIGTVGTPVPQTTQAFVGWAKYKERTLDDSAQASSWGVIVTDAYGGFTSAQTLPAVAFEADAIAQGVTISNKLIASVAGLKVQAGSTHNSTVTTGIQFYGAVAQVDASQTLTNWYGVYIETPTVAGTLTNKWSFYAKDPIQTEGGLVVGVSGSQTDSQRVLFVGEGASFPTNATLDARMAASQTGPSITVTDSGGVRRGQWFGSTGNLQLGNAATSGAGVAIISLATVTAPSGTPPTAGMYLYVDPADNDVKVKIKTADVRRLAPSHEQFLMEGLGFKSWSFDPGLGSGATAPTQGTVYVRALPLRANQVIANVVIQTGTAASGTPPTSMFVGLADSTGKMVAQSNDLRSSSIWTNAAGHQQAPLSGTYTVPADGLYYAVVLQVGAFGTTQPTFAKGVSNSAPGGIGTTIFGTGATTGQTTLPATNSNIAGGIVTTNGINYFFGAN